MTWNPFKKKKRSGLKLIGEYSGHRFYTLEEIGTEINYRFMRYYRYCQEADTLGVPLLYVHAIADQIRDVYIEMLAQETKIPEHQKAKRHWPNIEQQLRLLADQEGLKWHHYTIGVVENFILIDDEDPENPSKEHNDLKRKLFAENLEIRFFFIANATAFLKSLEVSFSDTNLVDYFQNLGSKPKLLNDIMSRLTSESFGKYETPPV